VPAPQTPYFNPATKLRYVFSQQLAATFATFALDAFAQVAGSPTGRPVLIFGFVIADPFLSRLVSSLAPRSLAFGVQCFRGRSPCVYGLWVGRRLLGPCV